MTSSKTKLATTHSTVATSVQKQVRTAQGAELSEYTSPQQSGLCLCRHSLAENDIRAKIIQRKISAGTRSDTGETVKVLRFRKI